MLTDNGLVSIKKIDGDIYVTITEKGDDVSTKLLQGLIVCDDEFANYYRKGRSTDSDEPFKN